MVDWSVHYDGIYAALGVPASITLQGTDGGSSISLTVIDKTAGEVFGDGVTVESIKPACDARAEELSDNDIDRENLTNASITFNGKTWTVTHHRMRPSPSGEGAGEVRMFLTEP